MLNKILRFPPFPRDFYPENLLEIKEIKFTPRHIDIISCLINGEKHKRIGKILSIEENTIDTHKRKIRDEIGKKYNQDIIPFIQNTNKIELIHQHYTRLVYKFDFEKKLNNLSVTSR